MPIKPIVSIIVWSPELDRDLLECIHVIPSAVNSAHSKMLTLQSPPGASSWRSVFQGNKIDR